MTFVSIQHFQTRRAFSQDLKKNWESDKFAYIVILFLGFSQRG